MFIDDVYECNRPQTQQAKVLIDCHLLGRHSFELTSDGINFFWKRECEWSF